MSQKRNSREGFDNYQYGNYGNNNGWYNSNLYSENDFMQFQNNVQNSPDQQQSDFYTTSSQNQEPSSFNYDSLYNTNDLTQKYSFIKSSFLYRPFSTNDNDYLSQVYYNNNPLEVQNMCANLDNTSCGLTSACVYVGNNKCVPGNVNGPYTTYSDVDMEYYYYKGKCYGNCPGRYLPGNNQAIPTPMQTTSRTVTNMTTIPSNSISPTKTTSPTNAPSPSTPSPSPS